MLLSAFFAQRRPFATRTGGVLALLCLAGAQPALAQQPPAAAAAADTPSVYLQAGRARGDTDALTLGVTLPWRSFQRELWGGQLRGYWDVYLSRWSYDPAPGRGGHSTVLGVTPTLRFTPDQGRSPVFWEGGIGATYADKRYVTPDREFSTRFNFASHLGVGLQFGQRRQHELALRVQHVSNAGIKKPNPGNNFVQLRYAMHF